MECADLSALWKTATCRSLCSAARSEQPKRRQVAALQISAPLPRLYFSCLPSYFCLMPKCPTCGKPVEWRDNSYRPFCSERCKLIDFSRWANEEYRVPGQRINP